MKAVMVGLALLSTSVAADTLSPQQRALAQCYGRNVRDLDDNLSDAASIARAVVAACRTERRAYLSTILKPNERSQLDRTEFGTQQDSIDGVTRHVLEARARARRTP